MLLDSRVFYLTTDAGFRLGSLLATLNQLTAQADAIVFGNRAAPN
jgi:hypothetical protein